ncbi:MAG: YbaK/EbsC family protein [Alicyclobacillus sp.]|nr:YbaK/EbsC family protein [Alicyclobacillus sp.]
MTILSMPFQPSAQKIQMYLHNRGYDHTVVELPESARTAAEAAVAIGCAVEQIAKSIVFRLRRSGEPLLVVASGTHRVNEEALSAALEDVVEKADAAFVRDTTGFVIGGVPPIGHVRPIQTVIDEDLLQYAEVWTAAGHPKAVVRMTPKELVELTGGRVMRVQ